MNYSQTLEFLFSSMPTFQEEGATAYKPGLERITAFCRHLGNPQRNFFTVHVAGTNGKGSVSHIIAAVLQQAGYRTGLFTSPHLHDFRERIRVDGEMIPKQKVVNFVDKHREKMTELGLSFFEMTAALAFDYFAQSDVEVAVIETGLGGRLDATNVILPIVIPVVLGEANDAYNDVFEHIAVANKTHVTYAEREFSCEMHEERAGKQHFRIVRRRDGHVLDFDLDLLGEYQCRNILTALAALDLMHEQTPLTISRRAFVDGAGSAARTTSLQGRWQTLGEHPHVICDTGHNAHGLACVAHQMNVSHAGGRLYCVMGFSNDKDLDAIFALLPRDAHYLFTQAATHRACLTEDLAARGAAAGLDCETVATVTEAVARARALAAPEDTIFIGGSTFVVAEVI